MNASGRLIQCTTLYKRTAGNQFSCNVYTHSTAKLFPLVETASPPRLDLSPGGPERGQLTPMPFSGVERPHRASGCYLNACTSHLYQTLVLPNLICTELICTTP